MTEPKFYLWSTKHTGDVCWWWAPNSKGYTRNLDAAGIYDEAEVRGLERSSEGEIRAVPVDVAKECALRMVRRETMRDELQARDAAGLSLTKLEDSDNA